MDVAVVDKWPGRGVALVDVNGARVLFVPKLPDPAALSDALATLPIAQADDAVTQLRAAGVAIVFDDEESS